MTATKSERLLNLVILLLVARTYVSKERIRETIEEYRTSPSDDAFEKKFERDKEELRALGIPIEVGSIDPLFDDEPGYRIARDAFELPEIDLGPDEVAVLGLAARVWQHAGLASTTSSALLKLRAAGHDVDRDALDRLQPTLPTDEAAFDPMLRATLERIPVRFGYRRAGEVSATERHLQPWGVVTARQRWYVVGLDTDRDAPRLFRLSRVEGAVTDDGPAGSFEVPPGTDLQALSRSLVSTPDHVEAVVLARKGAARGLRRTAIAVEEDARPGWDRLRLRIVGDQLLAQLLGAGDAVVVEEPVGLREQVRDRLRALVEEGTAS